MTPPACCPFCGEDRLTEHVGRTWFCAVCARSWIASEKAPETRDDGAGGAIGPSHNAVTGEVTRDA